MDGKFPSWPVSVEHGHEVTDDTPWGCQTLYDTNDGSSKNGKVITDRNLGQTLDRDLPNACPKSLHKEPVSRVQGILPEVSSSSSSSTHNASMAVSPDCPAVPSGTTPNSNFPVCQDHSTDNLRDVPEDYIERGESVMSNMYNSVNDPLAAAQQKDLKDDNPSTWTSVIKESLEMSNRMELEQDQLTDMCGTPLIDDPPTDSRAVEFVKKHLDPVDNMSDVQERREVTKAQEPTVIILSDDTKRSPFLPNQDFQQRKVVPYVDPLIDGSPSSVNDKVLGETRCETLKQSSFVRFYGANEVCSLAQNETTEDTGVSYLTKRPCLSDELGPVASNMHEKSNLNDHMSCVSLTASNSTGNEKGIPVLKQVLPNSSHRTSREHTPSWEMTNKKILSSGKCMDIETKSCSDNNATSHRHLNIPSHHLKLDTVSAEPSSLYPSTSDSKQDDLVHNLQKENSPNQTFNFQTPLEISRTWIESEESNLLSKKEESTNNNSNANCTPREPDVLTIAAQSSCRLVRKNENGWAHTLDDTPTCSPSHSSCELSSDTNNTSLMINNTDKKMDNGQRITQNIMNVGAVSDVTAHYNSQGQSQSLNVSSNPETGVNSVFSLENTSKEERSEVDTESQQTPTDFLQKESAQVEPSKDHSNHFAEHEHKISPDCLLKSSNVNPSSVNTPVTMKKRVGHSFKKRKLMKMAKVFSTIQELSENITAHSGKFSRDLKKINAKAKKMQSPRSRRKSCRTAITIRKQKKLLQNSHTEIKKHSCFRKRQKVTHPALVTDRGPKWCVKPSKTTKQNIGQVFKVTSHNFQMGSITTSRLLDCSKDPLKTEIHNEKHDIESHSSAKDFHSNTSNTQLKMPSESQKEDANMTESRKQALWNERNKEEAHNNELNGDAAFELSLQSTINSTGFHSCITSALDKKVKDEKGRNQLLGTGVKASDKHLEMLEQDVDVKNSLCGSNTHSNAISIKSFSIQKVDGFTQYCDEDYMPTLNKEACIAADVVKSTETAKKYISCKYCRRAFRHISAYTVHQRIHTGEKPYRCKLCGKNFAQLSKLKSHRNVHVQSVSLLCPCCRKEFSEKGDLIAHFTTHVKYPKQNNEPGQQESKPDAPLRDTIHHKSGNCNIYNNKFPGRYALKSHRHDQDKLMSCKTCGKEFQTFSHLVVHEKTHWPVKPYTCSICAKSFNQIKALKKHSRKHTGETPFSCSHCGRAFCDLPALRVHQKSKLCNRKQSLNGEDCDIEDFLVTHGVDGQVNTPVFFKCQICKQLYRKWCQYTLHLQSHTKSTPYICFACGQSYEKDSKVNAHCIVCCQISGEEVACRSSLSEILHPRKVTYLKDNLPTDVFSVEASKSNSLSNAGQFHKNSQTLSNLQTGRLIPESSRFEKASHLPETMHQSNDNRLLPSPTPSVMTCNSLDKSQKCDEKSPNLWRFKCPRCGQRYKRYRTLCLHMQTHAPTFRYVCGHCGHSFEKWNKLWLHQRIHRRKSRSYACSHCNLQFHFFSSYKMHLLNHAEERPYACPLCPQTFTHEEGLHAHQCNFHQPETKLQCDVCARSFSNLTNLVKHSLLHNGAISHQCLLCKLSFANNKSLQEHLNAHNNSACLLPSMPSESLTFLHKCNRCESSFSTGDLLYAHQICHTRDLKSQMRSTQRSESTSVNLGGTQSSTSRCLLSTLDLEAIAKESVYKYPHPDKLYVPSHLPRMSNSIPIINVDSGGEDLLQEASMDPVSPHSKTGPSGQKIPRSSQEYSETDRTHQPQGLVSQESVQSQNTEEIPALHMDIVTNNLQDKASHSSPTQMTKFVETSVFLEEPTTTVNPAENEIQNEIFECADCSEKLDSLIGLHEHYFLHALGNTNLYKFL